jgi:hypothetical protein
MTDRRSTTAPLDRPPSTAGGWISLPSARVANVDVDPSPAVRWLVPIPATLRERASAALRSGARRSIVTRHLAAFVLGTVRWLVAAMTRRPDPRVLEAWTRSARQAPASSWETELVAEYAETSLGRRIMARVDAADRQPTTAVRRPRVTTRIRVRARAPRRARVVRGPRTARGPDPPAPPRRPRNPRGAR